VVFTTTCLVFLFGHAVRGKGADAHIKPRTENPPGTGTVPVSGIRHDPGESYDWDTEQYEYNDNLYLTSTGQDGSVYYKTWEPEAKTGYQGSESGGSS